MTSEPEQSGQQVWMRSVLERYEGRLTRYAARITGDLESARDVTQETFLRLCAEEQAKVDGHLARWLFTVCRNRALDVRRKEGRMRTLSESGAITGKRAEPDPAQAIEGRERAGQVMQALAVLPENQQEVIRLRFQEGLSYKDIAAVSELTVTNVGYLIHTAIKKIRETLSERA